MRWLRRLLRTFRRSNDDRVIDAELAFHADMEADDLARTHGLAPAEARRQALVAFGGLSRFAGAARDVRRLAVLDACVRDARFGALLFGVAARDPLIYVGVTAVLLLAAAAAASLAARRAARISPLLALRSEEAAPLHVRHSFWTVE